MSGSRNLALQLTAKQEEFAVLVAMGNSYSEAYRETFDCENMSTGTIHNAASKLMKDEGVRGRVEEIIAARSHAILATHDSTKNFVLNRLMVESISAGGTPASRTRALELLGKTIGLFADRVEIESGERSSTMIEDELRSKIAKVMADLKVISH